MSNALSSTRKTVCGKPAVTFHRQEQILAGGILASALVLPRVQSQNEGEETGRKTPAK
jgi:hypothetical protein